MWGTLKTDGGGCLECSGGGGRYNNGFSDTFGSACEYGLCIDKQVIVGLGILIGIDIVGQISYFCAILYYPILVQLSMIKPFNLPLQ